MTHAHAARGTCEHETFLLDWEAWRMVLEPTNWRATARGSPAGRLEAVLGRLGHAPWVAFPGLSGGRPRQQRSGVLHPWLCDLEQALNTPSFGFHAC